VSGQEETLGHRLKTLARTQTCKVEHCRCGAVHVSLGGTTVRVNEQSARELRDALVRAMAEIDKPAVVEQPVSSPDDADGGPNVH
jgi:hypothetical protein